MEIQNSIRFYSATPSDLIEKSGKNSPILILTSQKSFKSKKPWASLSKDLAEKIQIALERRAEPLKEGGIQLIPGATSDSSDILVGVIGEDAQTFDLLGLAKKTLCELLSPHHKELLIFILDPSLSSSISYAWGAALAARTYRAPIYGKRVKDAKDLKLTNVGIAGGSKSTIAEFERGHILGEGTNIVRYLGTLPPNVLNTHTFNAHLKKVLQDTRIKVKFYSNKELKKMGAGSFTAVDQADPESEGGIYRLTYTPARPSKESIALVGKGICFDTGGYDVKTGGYMVSMKGDMQGAAVALSTMLTASRLQFSTQIEAFLAVTENHISPKGYKADEVVTALNGISIEVINTDAEGRMILADALALAAQSKPALIIDFATLTGSAVRAIGTGYGAGFTNRDALHEEMRQAGVESGERVWTFPIVKSYLKMLDSPVADTKQCVKSGSPDHIMAALFLAKFVDECPWVHIDLSASENDGGLAHTDTLYTGFGVLWAVAFLESKALQKSKQK